MEYINIIAQEEITKVPAWHYYLCVVVVIATIISLIIYLFLPVDSDKYLDTITKVGFRALMTSIIVAFVSSIFFRVPTGRYKYEATIDKDKITVSEYEKFIEEYNPTIKDGIYYWEEKE